MTIFWGFFPQQKKPTPSVSPSYWRGSPGCGHGWQEGSRKFLQASLEVPSGGGCWRWAPNYEASSCFLSPFLQRQDVAVLPLGFIL